MDWEKLESFEQVARLLSFSKAADNRHVSQSTISKHISALEAELGVKLFDRHGNTICLSPAGRQLARDVPAYINQYRFIESSLKTLSADFSSKLTIGVGHFEFSLFTPVLTRFVTKNPTSNVAYMYYSYSRLVSNCRTNSCDFGVGNHLCAASLDNMEVHTLYQERWVVAAREDSPFWQMPEDDQACLRDQLIITTYNNEFEPVRPHCLGNHLRQKAFIYSNCFVTIEAMLEAGLGVALIPEGLCPLLAANVRSKDILRRPLYVPVSVFFNPLNHNPSLRDLIDCCKEMYPNADW